MTGRVCGRLTVLQEAGKHRWPRWLCLCNCGKQTVVPGFRLRAGITKSCGCGMVASGPEHRNFRHGHGRKRAVTKLYRAWQSMRERCNCPGFAGYHLYGGRGITVCDRWFVFDTFADDMGPHPGPGFSLDRIDVDGNYEPSNCRWATRKEQAANKRPVKRLSDWSTAELLAELNRRGSTSI